MDKSSGKSRIYQAKVKSIANEANTNLETQVSSREGKRKLDEREPEANSEVVEESKKFKKVSYETDVGKFHPTRVDDSSSVRDAHSDVNSILREILLRIKKENAANRQDNAKFQNSMKGLIESIDQKLVDINNSIQRIGLAPLNNELDTIKAMLPVATEPQESERKDAIALILKNRTI